MRRGLALLVLVACSKPEAVAPPKPVAPPVVAAPPPPAPAPVLSKLRAFVGKDALRGGAFTPNGDVIAISNDALWRFHPGESNGTMIPIANVRTAVTAHTADVTVVVGENDTAYPFKDGKALAPYSLEHPATFVTISANGRILSMRGRDPRERPRTLFYEATTGKPLGVGGRIAALSPSGDFSVTEDQIVSTADGSTVVSIATGNPWIRTVAWMGEKVMAWGDDELSIADPIKKSETRYPAKCPPPSDVRDFVDPTNSHAFRICNNSVIVDVGLDGTRHEIHFDPGPLAKHSVAAPLVSADGSKLILDYNFVGIRGRPILEVDIQSGKSRPILQVPALRQEDAGARFFDALPAEYPGGVAISPNRQWALYDLTVIDLASRKPIWRRGRPDAPVSRTPLAGFIHESGLEIAAEVAFEAGTRVSRVGPDRKTPWAAPKLEAESPCPVAGGYEPFRHFSGNEAIYTWPYGGSCVCDAKACTTPALPDMAVARRKTATLRTGESGLELVVGKTKTALPITETDPNLAAAFIDDNTAVALSVKDKSFELKELTLTPPAVVTTRSIPAPDAYTYSVATTPQTIAVVKSSINDLTALLLPRGTSTTPLATVTAWPGHAIVKLANDKVEIFGEPDPALACVESDGVVRPFSTCRERFESKGVFRVE